MDGIKDLKAVKILLLKINLKQEFRRLVETKFIVLKRRNFESDNFFFKKIYKKKLIFCDLLFLRNQNYISFFFYDNKRIYGLTGQKSDVILPSTGIFFSNFFGYVKNLPTLFKYIRYKKTRWILKKKFVRRVVKVKFIKPFFFKSVEYFKKIYKNFGCFGGFPIFNKFFNTYLIKNFCYVYNFLFFKIVKGYFTSLKKFGLNSRFFVFKFPLKRLYGGYLFRFSWSKFFLPNSQVFFYKIPQTTRILYLRSRKRLKLLNYFSFCCYKIFYVFTFLKKKLRYRKMLVIVYFFLYCRVRFIVDFVGFNKKLRRFWRLFKRFLFLFLVKFCRNKIFKNKYYRKLKRLRLFSYFGFNFSVSFFNKYIFSFSKNLILNFFSIYFCNYLKLQGQDMNKGIFWGKFTWGWRSRIFLRKGLIWIFYLCKKFFEERLFTMYYTSIKFSKNKVLTIYGYFFFKVLFFYFSFLFFLYCQKRFLKKKILKQVKLSYATVR